MTSFNIKKASLRNVDNFILRFDIFCSPNLRKAEVEVDEMKMKLTARWTIDHTMKVIHLDNKHVVSRNFKSFETYSIFLCVSKVEYFFFLFPGYRSRWRKYAVILEYGCRNKWRCKEGQFHNFVKRKSYSFDKKVWRFANISFWI